MTTHIRSWSTTIARQSRSGMTLLESMVSLLILGGSLSAIIGALSSAHGRLRMNDIILSGIQARESLLDGILMMGSIDSMLLYDGHSQLRGDLTDHDGQPSVGASQAHDRMVSIQPSSIQAWFGDITQVNGVIITIRTTDPSGWSIDLHRFVPTGTLP